MFSKEDILSKIDQHKAGFQQLNAEVENYTVQELFDTYFYEESEDLPTVGFNPQSGEHLRVGDKIYYHPDYSHLVPEELRNELRVEKLNDQDH